jgi:hypothetical protein
MSNPAGEKIHLTISVRSTSTPTVNSHLNRMMNDVNLTPLRITPIHVEQKQTTLAAHKKALQGYSSHKEWYQHSTMRV